MRTAERRIAERAMFLQGCYEACSGRVLKSFNADEVALGLGLAQEDAQLLVVEMVQRGYLGDLCSGEEAAMTAAGLDATEQIETLDQAPPPFDQAHSMIIEAKNCNINVGSELNDVTQRVEAVKEKWWEALTDVGKRLIRELVA